MGRALLDPLPVGEDSPTESVVPDPSATLEPLSDAIAPEGHLQWDAACLLLSSRCLGRSRGNAKEDSGTQRGYWNYCCKCRRNSNQNNPR
ncbi:dynein light chain roadblock-type 2 isoform X3 [Chelonia mydas]|uniref:dynein light chain roadblock-type 2 isoform X3 n=1 Tax=Chelonia mydas TaxID=8469 RepID=UPI001CA94E9B|nr:dynein light chain roadblock-type 2 isoform X3 [Chelonia mydas]